MGLQILTHVKEKLQFAQKEKEGMQVELDAVEGALATHRDDLARVKLTRDKALVATRKIRDAGSHVTNAALLADLEVSKGSWGDGVAVAKCRLRCARHSLTLVYRPSQNGIWFVGSLLWRKCTPRRAHPVETLLLSSTLPPV